MSRALGALHFYPEDKDPSVYLTFKLYEGENTIGSLPDCDVQLNYPDISEKHLQITLSSELEYSFEDLGSKQGVFKALGEKSRQQLKPKKEYELVSDKPFYISNKYKCIFEAYEEAEPEPEVDFDHVETLEMSNNGDEEQEYDHPTILMMENTQIIPSIPPIDDEEEDEEETEKFESQKSGSGSRKKTQSMNSSQKEKVSLSPKMMSQDLRVERKKSDNEKRSPSSQNFLKPEGKEVKSAMKKVEQKENGKETKTAKRQVRIAEESDDDDGEAHYGEKEEKSPVTVVQKSKKDTNTKAKAKSPVSSPISTQKDEKKKATTTQTKKAAAPAPVAENGPKKGRGRPKKEEKVEKIEKIIEQGKVEKDFFEEEEEPVTRKNFKKANKVVQFIEEEKSSETESESKSKTQTESSSSEEEEEKLFGSSKSETSEEEVKPRTPYFGSLENSRTTTDSFKKNSEIIKGENKKNIQSLNPVSSSEEIYYFGDEGLVASKKKQPNQYETDPESFGASLEGEPSFYCVGEEIIPIKRQTPKSSKTKMEEEDGDPSKYGMVSQELSGKKSNRNSAKREDKKSSINGKRSSDEDSLDEYELASTISKKFKPDGGNDRALPAVPPTTVSKSAKSTLKKDSLKKEEPEEVKKKTSEKGKKQKKKEKGEIENSFMINTTKRNVYQVMFSGIEFNSKFKKDQQNLTKLGAKIIEDKDKEFSVLVMNDFKRTIKFLLALSKGIDIVNYDWVTDSIKQKELLSVDEYIYKDKAAETKYRFNLASSLEDAKNRMTGLLAKYSVYISPSIKPSFEELRLLVLSLGGTVTRARPFKYSDNLLVLLNEDDKKNIEEFKNVGFTPYTSEVIYSAILQQKLSLDSHRI